MLEEHRYAFRLADTRAVHVYVDDRLILWHTTVGRRRESDQEWLPLHGQRNVPGLPSVLPQVEIFAFFEPEQRNRLQLTGIRVALKHDRVFRLQAAKLQRKNQRRRDIVAVPGRAIRDNAQVPVRYVIE